MKQHITKGQYLELDEEKRNKLARMVFLEKEDTQHNYLTNAQIVSSATTIGKMIELLNEYVPHSKCMEDSIDIECDRVTKTAHVEYRLSNFTFAEFSKGELCDALWEAVKSIL